MKRCIAAWLLGSIVLLGAGPLMAEPAGEVACKSSCDNTRLLCSRRDAHGFKCGQQYAACVSSCDPNSPKTSHIASCTQHCEDAGQQCGIANNNAQACKDGRDACLDRCAARGEN